MSDLLHGTIAPVVYLLAAMVLFTSIKALLKARTAAHGWRLGAVGLALAFIGGVLEVGTDGLAAVLAAVVGGAVLGGLLASGTTEKSAPAVFSWIPGFAGGAAALVALGTLLGAALDDFQRLLGGTATVLGGVAFLLGVLTSLRRTTSPSATAAGALAAFLAGWSLALTGIALENLMMIVGGGVTGTAALAFGRLLGAASGRGFAALLSGGDEKGAEGYADVRSCGAEEVAMVLETAHEIVVVPGYGMAAAGAQHPVRELAELLRKRGANVVWAVHPSAGIVPGHMNIALDEANVTHDRVLAASEARTAIDGADAVLVVGANDVVNARGSREPASALHGMEALDLTKARSVFVVKRSLRPGTAGVKNPLFEQPNTMMVFGDAKRVMQSVVAELKGAAH